ncbi:hypothetical protein [Cupriavidus necator]|uniref:hypothetical protein n=1 Tax=Cupriavidus necator TaxID=106590 RepID=UPI0005B51A76|nr:hypothetical protein [Cupriavidus necator]
MNLKTNLVVATALLVYLGASGGTAFAVQGDHPFEKNARANTIQNLGGTTSRSVLDRRDPYRDDARTVTERRDPYTDGARTVTEPRNPFYDGA